MANTLKENIKTINDIGSKSYGNKIKNKTKANMRGAMIGGGVGVLLAVASRQNPYIFGIIGLIAGRFLLGKMK